MGTLNLLDFEGGAQDATVTLANSASGFTALSVVGSGTAVCDAASAVVGSKGAKVVANSGQTCAIRATLAVPSKTYYFDHTLPLPSTRPAAGVRWTLTTVRRNGGVIANWQLDENGRVVLEIGGTVYNVSAQNLATSSVIRMSLGLVVGSSTNDGQVTAKVYTSGNNWTTQSGSTYTSSTMNLGTTEVYQIDCGSLTAGAAGTVFRYDYVRAEDGRTTEFGAPPQAGATVASAGSPQSVVVGATVTLDATGSTGSGLSYAWSNTARPDGAAAPTITNPSAATTTVTLGAAGRYTFAVTVTGQGGTDTASVTEFVAEASQQDVKVFSSTGSATNEGGAASKTAALNDTSSATRLELPAGGTETIVLNPVGMGPVSIFVAGNWTGTSLTRTVTIRNEAGAQLQTPTTYTLTSVEVEREIVLDSGALAALPTLADRRALQVQISDAA